MGDVVRLDDYRAQPVNPGNGAREALQRIFCDWTGAWSDYFLMTLWAEGFRVVPLESEPNDAA